MASQRDRTMKRYTGRRAPNGTLVEVDGLPLAPPPRIVHPTTEFEWGYFGSGPLLLAEAILADCLGPAAAAAHALAFLHTFVARFESYWELHELDVRAWFARVATEGVRPEGT
jgi:hypothetical protein